MKAEKGLGGSHGGPSVRVEDVGDFGRAINMKVSCLPLHLLLCLLLLLLPCRRQPVKYSNSRNWNEAPWRQINWKYFTFSASTARQSMCRSIYPFLSVPFRSFCLIIQLRFRKIFVCCLTRFDFDSVSPKCWFAQPQAKSSSKILGIALRSGPPANLGGEAEKQQPRGCPAQPEFRPGNAFTGQRACNRCCLKPLWGIIVSQRIFGQAQIYWLIGILGISFKLRFARLGPVVLFFFGPGQGIRWGLGFNACCIRDPPRQRNNDDAAPRHVQPIFPSPENTKLK